MGLINPDRSIEGIDNPAEWLNNVGWELGAATGLIDVNQPIVTVDWDELLKRSVQLIEAGRYYEEEYGRVDG